MVVAGIMTGTSVDAIDVAVCLITHEGDRHSVSLISFESSPFSEASRDAIVQALAGNASMELLSDLPFHLAHDYAAAIRSVQR